MRLNKAYLLLISILFGLIGQSQTIISGGYVSGVWDSTSGPYIIQDTIRIHKDSGLSILEGVHVEFYDSAYLMVDGYISAVGTLNDSIVFSSAQNTWQGIRISANDSVYNNNLLFYFCHFVDAHASGNFLRGGAMSIEGRNNISIFNCSFQNNFVENRGAAIYMWNADVQLKKGRFEMNTTGEGTGPGASKGGAIYVHDSDCSINDIVFQYNESIVAGALYSDNSSITAKDCNFFSNSSLAGGGAFVCHKSGVIAVDYCIFENNTANGSGGAIALLEGIWARFRNCSVIENISETELYLSDGGGVLITPYDNQVSFINCEISNNKAGDFGGGVYATSDTDFIGCLFNSNSAALDSSGSGGGGAIVMSLSYNEVVNTTFSGNSGAPGTTILCEDAGFSLINTIIWDDTIGADAKIYMSTVEEPPRVYISHSDIEGGSGVIRGTGAYLVDWASGNIDSNPMFELPGSDFLLSNESPCIDTGRIDTLQLLIPLKDIARNPRIYRDKIDLGCYENQFPFWVEELIEEPDILAYPNPARDFFYLGNNTGGDVHGKLLMTDIAGRIIMEKGVNIRHNSTIRQSLNGMPPGLYILSLSTKDIQYSFKLITR